MLYLASYDIDDNKLRQKLANCLLAYGLERLQKSVFIGSLDSGPKRLLLKEVEQCFLDEDKGRVRFLLMPLAEAYARKSYWRGDRPPDWNYYSNQTLTLIV